MEPNKRCRRTPWNEGTIVGQKAPLKLKEVWAIRIRLQSTERARDLAMFDLGIDSKLRACDLMQLRVQDICHGDRIASRAIVMQQKNQAPGTVRDHRSDQRRRSRSGHLSTRQYSRIVHSWIRESSPDSSTYSTHSIRRTKASLIYRRTKNLRAVQLLLGHAKLESTVRYLGIEVDDALEMAEQAEV